MSGLVFDEQHDSIVSLHIIPSSQFLSLVELEWHDIEVRSRWEESPAGSLGLLGAARGGGNRSRGLSGAQLAHGSLAAALTACCDLCAPPSSIFQPTHKYRTQSIEFCRMVSNNSGRNCDSRTTIKA